MTKFSHSDYTEMCEETFSRIRELAVKKGGEYSGDSDRLANFRRNAERLGIDKETVWAVYAAKHWDALMQYIQDERAEFERPRMESIDGRIDDLLVYLLLFKAMLVEKRRNVKTMPKIVDEDDMTA